MTSLYSSIFIYPIFISINLKFIASFFLKLKVENSISFFLMKIKMQSYSFEDIIKRNSL